MKKILVICQYFYPEQFRINDICTEWVKRGYDVTVVTGIPNYPQGRFYDRYGLFTKRRELWNGIKIIRIPLIPRGNTSVGMVLNYLSFPVSGFFWNLFTNVKVDYVFMFETSPMTQCKIGVRYARKHHVPLYLYVQDLWPENVEVVTGIHNPLVINPIDRMVDKIYAACDEIFVTSPSFVKALTGRKKSIHPNKVHYWPQYAEDFYKPIDKADAVDAIRSLDSITKTSELVNDEAFKIAFAGNIGYAQGLEILPRTAKAIRDLRVKFVIVGDGRYKERFLSEIDHYGVSDMFIIIDRQLPETIPYILSLCDTAYISFMDTELFSWTIPAKLQSYMACGMPILASARGETKRIVEEAECGVCVPIGDAEALAKVITGILSVGSQTADLHYYKEKYGSKARQYFEKNFTKKKLMDEFEEFLK